MSKINEMDKYWEQKVDFWINRFITKIISSKVGLLENFVKVREG